MDISNKKRPSPLAITGIHTDIGKTVCSAVLVRALQCDYWKPIQAGGLDDSDSDRVRRWTETAPEHIHSEAFRLQMAASPHVAAHAENIQIQLNNLAPPQTEHPLLIETAGGVCSPINDQLIVADVLSAYQWPTVLVIQHYLGSISHTISAIDVLKIRNIPILGLIITGARNIESERFIEQYTGISIIARIATMQELSSAAIADQALKLKQRLPTELKHWSLHGYFEPFPA